MNFWRPPYLQDYYAGLGRAIEICKDIQLRGYIDGVPQPGAMSVQVLIEQAIQVTQSGDSSGESPVLEGSGSPQAGRRSSGASPDSPETPSKVNEINNATGVPEKLRNLTQTVLSLAAEEAVQRSWNNGSSVDWHDGVSLFAEGAVWQEKQVASAADNVRELKLEIERLKQQAVIDARTLAYRQALLNDFREKTGAASDA